jgi:hypothetical protein
MLFDKLVAIRSKDEFLFERICRFARTGSHVSVAKDLEQCALDNRFAPKSAVAKKLYTRVSRKQMIQLFRQPPHLSEIAPNDLLTVAGFADLQPDPENMFATSDAVLMRLIDLIKQGPIAVDKLIQDDLAQLAVVHLYYSSLSEGIRRLARAGTWMADMIEIERRLTGDNARAISAEGKLFWSALENISRSDADLTPTFLSQPRFSCMLPEEVLAYGAIRSSLPNPDDLLDKTYTASPSRSEKGRALAKLAFAKLLPSYKELIERSYKLRQETLDSLLKRRIFVKKDLLEHCWPDLYDRMRRDYIGMIQFERQIQRPEICTEDELQQLEPYLRDERLVRVLKSLPYFGHSTGGAPSPELPATFDVVTATPPATVAVTAKSEKIIPTAAVIEVPRIEYEDVYITLHQSNVSPSSYDVEMRVGDRTITSREQIDIDWKTVRDSHRRLLFRDQARERSISTHPQYENLLKEMGLFVYDTLFKGEMRRELLELLSTGRNYRIHWEGDPKDPRCVALPWECLYVPTAQLSFLALTRKYSLTRRSAIAKSIPARPIGGALRFLFVTASPETVAPLNTDHEIETLTRVAAAWKGKVELEVVQHASVETVISKLREFRPHLFHFSGHGFFQDEIGQLIFETSDGRPQALSADQIAVLLYDYEVFLAVLNGCDTGVSSTNDAVSSVAGALVKAGVPAVVATTREVEDAAAMQFTREFYRCFLAGFTVEGSLAEARKALSLDSWDWSAYALFVGSVDLNSLRVMTSVRSDPSL